MEGLIVRSEARACMHQKLAKVDEMSEKLELFRGGICGHPAEIKF